VTQDPPDDQTLRREVLSISLDPVFMTFIAPRVAMSFSRAARWYPILQTLVDQGMLACALERYYLAHREYPENLEALSPEVVKVLPRIW